MKSNTTTEQPEVVFQTSMLPTKIFARQRLTKFKRSSACRNLFGQLDRKATDEFLERQLSILAECSSQEWSFDFINGVPIANRPNGRYVWELVVPSEKMVQQFHPSFAAYPIVIRETDKADPSADCEVKMPGKDVLENMGKENSLLPMSGGADVTEIPGKMESKCQEVSRLVQTSIKGFLKVQKRRSSKRLRLKRRKSQFLNKSHKLDASYSLSRRGRGIKRTCS